MTKQDITFVPVSDVALSDVEVINQHKTLVDELKYNEAVTLLNDSGYQKGVRASFINSLVSKIQTLGLYLLNLTANQEDYYSVEEPDAEWMRENGKLYWIEVISGGE